MPDVDRREFLVGVGLTAGAGALVRRVPTRQAPAVGPFAWGVASFDPSPSSVLLWTRVTAPAGGGSVAVSWTLADDEGFHDHRAQGSVEVGAATDHTVRVDVEGLPSGRTYWYRFELPDGTTSPVGRTRTMGGSDELRLGVVSCARFATAGFAVYRALAERDVDLVVHVGDYVYEDGQSDQRSHDPAHRCTTLADYRTRYAQHRGDPDLQALHAAHPMVAVWDDHEVAGNAWRGGAAQHDEGRDGPWLDRLVAAGRAHEEWLPGRTSVGDDGRHRLWRAVDLGPMAELIVLDTRTWGRDRQPRTADEVNASEGRSMLGADQLAFVQERLGPADRRRWSFLANQVMLHPLRIPAPVPSIVDAVERGGFVVLPTGAVNPDQWDGYAHEREVLVDGIGSTGGVVALTGDVHSSWAWEGSGDDTDDTAMVELVTPSVTSVPFADRLSLPTQIIAAALRATQPGLRHVELTRHGYLVVGCTSDVLHAEWWHVDPADATTQERGAALTTPRDPPMRLTPTETPLNDRLPTTGSTAAPRSTTADSPPSDDDPPIALTVGAAAGIALVAGGLALRRRRR